MGLSVQEPSSLFVLDLRPRIGGVVRVLVYGQLNCSGSRLHITRVLDQFCANYIRAEGRHVQRALDRNRSIVALIDTLDPRN